MPKKKISAPRWSGVESIIDALVYAYASVHTAYKFLRDAVDREAREYALTKLHEGVRALDTAIDRLDAWLCRLRERFRAQGVRHERPHRAVAGCVRKVASSVPCRTQGVG
jgi:hypothetical protein